MAVGALAIGALAIGALAIRKLGVKKASFDDLEVGNLRVRNLEVTNLTVGHLDIQSTTPHRNLAGWGRAFSLATEPSAEGAEYISLGRIGVPNERSLLVGVSRPR